MDTKNLPKAKTKKNEITFIANGENYAHAGNSEKLPCFWG